MKIQHQLLEMILVPRGKLTICISYLALVLESSSDSNAENQKDPVDVRDVNLPQEFL